MPQIMQSKGDAANLSAAGTSLRLELLERLQANIEPSWGEIAELLRTALQGDHCVVTLHHGPNVHETIATAGLSPEWEDRYEARYAGLNPFVIEAQKRRPQTRDFVIGAADHLVPSAELRKREFFKEFWSPLGVNDSIGILFFDGSKSLGHISIRRKSGAQRYGEQEEALLRSVVDILKAALARSRELRLLEARAAAFERLNVDQGGGLVVFDERNSVLEVEGVGRHLLEKYKNDLIKALTIYRADTTQYFHTIPTAAPAEGVGETVAAKEPLGFHIEFRRSAIEGRARTLCIVKTNNHGGAKQLSLPENIRLTPRERDVVQYLAQGLDNLSIAKALNIGLYTTKDHVKAIFRKLGVKTRAEAVAVLARTAQPRPPVRPAPG
jgi:DNA-binding CsgD family transcriptional regulator